ncbi:MAG: MAPEG family protein [Brevundimonas sp.]|nr:MAG: MAPEG family protein [Brevundimonas sp.]
MSPALLNAALWSGLLIFVMIVLSLRVILGRWQHRVSLGEGLEGQLSVAARSFGNCAEYVPGIAAMTLVALVGASTVEVNVIGGTLLLGRVLHPLGLMMKAPNWARLIGMVLTLFALGFAAVLLIMATMVA